jgi:hypothetical protein
MEKVVVSEQAKTHTLFMGADIAINLGKEPYAVKNVTGSSWVIDVDGRERLIPTKGAPLDLRITPALKLTEVSAKINGFNKVPAFSYANDPSVRLTKGLNDAAMQNAMLTGIALDAQHTADTVSNKALGPMATFASSNQQFGSAAMMNTAQTILATTHPGAAVPGSPAPPPNPNVSSTLDGLDGAALAARNYSQVATSASAQTTGAEEPTDRLATRGFDAMEIDFEISCPKPLRDPYVVTMTRFRTPDTRPGMVQTLVYAQALDPIDSRPTSVHFTEEGFPFNYELVDFQLHIYDQGVEVATNIASKRVELTREEAFQYVLIEYLSSHKHDTLAATATMGRLPSDLHTQLALGKYAGTFYVKVSKDGLGGDPYTDMLCTQRIVDPYLETVISGIRFKPALDNGKPVEGVAPLNLNKLGF